MTDLNVNDAGAWQRFVNDFDNTSRLFAQSFNDLQRLGPYVRERHPELATQYNALVARGGQHQAQLAQLANLRNQVTTWLTGIGRAVQTTYNSTMDWLRQRFGLGGMGAVPLVVGVVGVAAAAAVIALVARWITEAYQFTQRLNALERLERQGLSPQEAARVVNQTVGAPSQPGIFGIPWTYLIGGVALIVLGPPLLRMISERRK